MKVGTKTEKISITKDFVQVGIPIAGAVDPGGARGACEPPNFHTFPQPLKCNYQLSNLPGGHFGKFMFGNFASFRFFLIRHV